MIEKKQYLEIDQLWPGFSGSFSLALALSLSSRHQKVIQLFLSKMMKFSLKSSHFFTQKKLDEFLVTT